MSERGYTSLFNPYIVPDGVYRSFSSGKLLPGVYSMRHMVKD